MLYMSNSALDYTLPLISAIAVDTKNEGTFVWVYANSNTNYFRSAKALSNTSPAIEGSRSACKSAVAAPIDLPHNPTVFTFLSYRK
jgi:hypothetical protein